ncbi:glycosyltransferase family A protein [Myxosarcina sp. GI1]|uniref:glycosyltransferase family 2 protein n=1 Tax=Myxosarcina sp. GI1 TaxID=1541065 RepID=UPI00068DCED5|nr:glycosyltransferase family A protein [Myxosarcina sp. GI1]
MNKPIPKVSVLMCVYNGETHLKEAVNSILKQTFKDFEFVIVDDGSTDSSWQILNEYSIKDSRIVLVQNQENLGLEKSLNKGLAATTGKYLARQDADDISFPERLQLQVNFLDTHQQVGAVGSSIEFIDRQGKVLSKQNLPEDHDSLQSLLLINNCLWHSSMTVRNSLLKELGGYNEQMLHAEDYDLWWRISCNSCLATLPDVLLHYRQDNSAAITKLKRKKQLQCSQQISYKAINQCLQDRDLSSLNEKAHERLWWTYLELIDRQSYKKWWYDERGKSGLLQQQDFRCLKPFWNLLVNRPAGTKIWGTRFYQLSNHLLRSRQTLVGLQLLWILKTKLNISIQWNTTIKALIKPYLPGIKQINRFYRNHHFLKPKIDRI